MEQSPSPKHVRRNAVAIAVSVVVVIAAVFLAWRQHSLDQGKVVIDGDIRVRVDVADSIFTRERGLSGRPTLAADEGMLFVFSAPARYQFWMKQMRFPIDIIWIDGGEIVDITTDVPPPEPGQLKLPTYFPAVPASQVLEVSAGFAKAHGLRTGMTVELDLER